VCKRTRERKRLDEAGIPTGPSRSRGSEGGNEKEGRLKVKMGLGGETPRSGLGGENLMERWKGRFGRS
jgi:hypothetical protein